MSDSKFNNIWNRNVLSFKAWWHFKRQRLKSFLWVCLKWSIVRILHFLRDLNFNLSLFTSFCWKFGHDFHRNNIHLFEKWVELVVAPCFNCLLKSHLIKFNWSPTLWVVNIQVHHYYVAWVKVILVKHNTRLALGLTNTKETTDFVYKVYRKILLRYFVHWSLNEKHSFVIHLLVALLWFLSSQ